MKKIHHIGIVSDNLNGGKNTNQRIVQFHKNELKGDSKMGYLKHNVPNRSY